MPDTSSTRPPHKRLFTILFLALATCGALIATRLWQVRQQDVAVQHVISLGGHVSRAAWYQGQEDVPQWIQRLLPPPVYAADLHDTLATNEDIRQLGTLADITRLDLSSTRIAEGGLAPLAKLTKLEKLQLDNTQIADPDLNPLAKLPLRNLSLAKTNVTVAGLRCFGRQSAIIQLDLCKTRVRDSDLGALAAFPLLQHLSLDETQVTAVSSAKLKSLPSLQIVSVQVDSGTGKAIRDILAQIPGIGGAGFVGEDGSAVLWNSELPWTDTLAGVAEAIMQDANWPANRTDELIRALSRVCGGNAFAAAGMPINVTPGTAPVSQTELRPRTLTCEEFVELAKSSDPLDHPALQSFVESPLTDEALTCLIKALDAFEGVPKDGPLERSLSDQLRWITKALVRHSLANERTVQAVERLLKNGNRSVRAITVYSFDPYYDGLLYSDPSPDVAKALPAVVVRLLSPCTGDPDPEVRSAAAIALTRAVSADPSQAEAVMPLLVSMLNDKESHLSVLVYTVLAVRRAAEANPVASHDAVPQLCRLLETAQPEMKPYIVDALVEVACRNAGDSEEVAILLLKLLPDERPKPLSAGRHSLYLIARHQPTTLGRIMPIVLEMLSEPEPVSTAAGETLSAIAEGVHARISGKTTDGTTD